MPEVTMGDAEAESTSVCPHCSAKILGSSAPVVKWYRSTLTAWLSIAGTLVFAIAVTVRSFEHISATVDNLNNAVTYDEKRIEQLDTALKIHHENSSLHLSDRDAADFQAMKRTINEISAEQGQIHRMLAEIDRKLRFK